MNEEIVNLVEEYYPFTEVQKEKWQAIKARLISLDRLNRDNVLEFDKALSGLGDGHTRIKSLYKSKSEGIFPVDLVWNEDRLIWIKDNNPIIIESINNVDVASVLYIYRHEYNHRDLFIKRQIISDIKNGLDGFDSKELNINGIVIQRKTLQDLFAEIGEEKLKHLKKLSVFTHSQLTEDTLYIKLTSFYEGGVVDEIKQLLNQLQNKHYEIIIFDIRDNNGGYVDIAKEIASLIVPRKVRMDYLVCDSKGNQEDITIESSSSSFPCRTFYLFVNENTQSCAEYIFARALKLTLDNLIIVGAKTAGLSGQAKELIIDNSFLLSITTRRYVDRETGQEVECGVVPDVEIDSFNPVIESDNYIDWFMKQRG